MSLPLQDPVSRRQAREILANPAAWGHRPSLVALARMVAASAEGYVVTQRRLAGRPTRRAPFLRVIDGGLSETAHRGRA